MDNKILNFIIGILVGVCVTTACFLIYMKLNNTNIPNGIPNMQENVKQMREFDKNGGDFNKEEMKNLKNKENGNEGDIESNVKESKGVPPNSDSTNNNNN